MSPVWTTEAGTKKNETATPFDADEDVAQPLLYMACPTAYPAYHPMKAV